MNDMSERSGIRIAVNPSAIRRFSMCAGLPGILMLISMIAAAGCASDNGHEKPVDPASEVTDTNTPDETGNLMTGDPVSSDSGSGSQDRGASTIGNASTERGDAAPKGDGTTKPDDPKPARPVPPKNPKSLNEVMAYLAAEVAAAVPEEEPWMVMVSVGSEDAVSKHQKAIANSLVHHLQKASGGSKAFMVTTPELRKQILEEQTKSMGDFYNEETGAEIGNMVRAHAVLKAPVHAFEKHVGVTLQLVSMDTGAVVKTCSYDIPIGLLPVTEKIRDEFLYSSYRNGSHAIRTLDLPANTVGLEVSVDRPQVFEGQTYNIEVKTRSPGYLYLFDLQTDGTLSVLLPNRIPLEELNGGFLDNRLPVNGRFTTKGRFELTASITGRETILAVLTEGPLDTSSWTKVFTKELGPEYPQYHTYSFGRDGSIRDSLMKLKAQLKAPTTGRWHGQWIEISIIK